MSALLQIAIGERKTYNSRRYTDDSNSTPSSVSLNDIEQAIQETLSRMKSEQIEFVHDEDDGFRGFFRRLEVG